MLATALIKVFNFMIELHTFIKQALLDIVNGISDAQKEAGQGVFVPAGIGSDYECIRLGVTHLQSVEFSISVTADSSTGKSAKIGVLGGIVGGALSAGDSAANSQVSRISFKVPVQLPVSGRADFHEDPSGNCMRKY